MQYPNLVHIFTLISLLDPQMYTYYNDILKRQSEIMKTNQCF